MKSQTKTKTTTLTQEEKDEMAQISHESDMKSAPSYKLASVKLHGKEGNYRRTLINANGELKVGDDGRAILEDMGKTIRGTILRSRITFADNGAEVESFSNEGNKGGKFSIFCKTANKEGKYSIQHVFNGTIEQIKERFPELKYIQILYFLLEDGEIVRLKVKGMSLAPVFNYLREFSDEEHVWEYITELGFASDKNKFGSFKVSTFKRGAKVADIKQVQIAMKEVNEKLTAIEKYHADKEASRVNEEGKEGFVPKLTDEDVEIVKEQQELPAEEGEKVIDENGEIDLDKAIPDKSEPKSVHKGLDDGERTPIPTEKELKKSGF